MKMHVIFFKHTCTRLQSRPKDNETFEAIIEKLFKCWKEINIGVPQENGYRKKMEKMPFWKNFYMLLKCRTR